VAVRSIENARENSRRRSETPEAYSASQTCGWWGEEEPDLLASIRPFATYVLPDVGLQACTTYMHKELAYSATG